MAKGTDGDTAQKVERDTSLNIYQRVHACAGELGFLEKDKTVKFGGQGKGARGEYEYISHDLVTKEVRGPMLRHGIMVQPNIVAHEKDGNRTEIEVDVAFVNIDKPDDRITIHTIGYGVDTSDKGPGKAFSYAMKYAYLKLFLLNSADDIEKDTLEHDPAAPRASSVAEARNEATKALETWATNFKAALVNAKTEDEVNELQKRNKASLMDAPDVTREYFVDLIENRKKELTGV